jgi:C4-dicarboxylate-specific signal transduction histidine kinase
MPVPAVRANRIELQQVLLNLTMNAIEAMSTMSGGDRVLKLTTEVTRTGRVVITVQDSGPGIALDQLDLIFKSFFTTKPGGMGVGLPISKTIVEAQGGQLTVAHGDPVGMVFTIDLPLRVRRQHVANNRKPAAESKNGSPSR